MPITLLPTPPTRSDSVNFNSRADAFLSALPTFAAEANLLQADVNVKQSQAAASAAAALASELAAAASSNVTVWVSGTTYSIGDVRFSPVNFMSYRRRTAGAGTTDPSLDATNWALLTWDGTVVPVANGGTGATSVPDARTALSVPSIYDIQGQSNVAFTTTGTEPAFILTPNPAIGSRVTGQTWVVTFHATPPAGSSLNVSGTGSAGLRYYANNGVKSLIPADGSVIRSGWTTRVRFDGTHYVVLDPVPQPLQYVTKLSPDVKLGYNFGSGDSVIQATSKSTAVSITAPSGQITTHNASLAAGATVSFNVLNSYASSPAGNGNGNDYGVLLSCTSVNYRVEAVGVAGSQFTIRLTNLSGGSLAEAVVIKFGIVQFAVV